jgi:hypothetical protein
MCHRGSTLTIEAVGDLLEDVDDGAYVVLQVKYGLIRLVNTEADLCEQVSNVDLTCPIKKGKTTIVKDVELPKEIPPVSTHLIPWYPCISHTYDCKGNIHRFRRCLYRTTREQEDYLLGSDRYFCVDAIRGRYKPRTLHLDTYTMADG